MLVNIPTIQCPHCGSKTIERESRFNKHCSGEWNEERTFFCGLRLAYSPNFREVTVANACPHSRENKLRLLSQLTALGKLEDTVNSLGLDDKTTKRLLDNLDFLKR